MCCAFHAGAVWKAQSRGIVCLIVVRTCVCTLLFASVRVLAPVPPTLFVVVVVVPAFCPLLLDCLLFGGRVPRLYWSLRWAAVTTRRPVALFVIAYVGLK